MSKVLVTGGAGFIGSAFTRLAVKQGYKVVVVDKLTYAGDLARLEEVKGKYKFYKADICDQKAVADVCKKEKPEAIINFAAETHVDRSILDAGVFLKTNIFGTQVLLDVSRKYKIKKLIHISTDEVFGDIKKGKFTESSPLKPNSPYAASKAAADLLIKSYVRTYNFPAIIVRPSNNYGPWQYPEKFIPVIIYKAMKNESVPVYAKGTNVREWLYVDDCARGILLALSKARLGEVYNIGSGQEKTNIEVAKSILSALARPHSLIKHVQDRPGHDLRYALDSSKIKKLGWSNQINFKAGIGLTLDWHKKNSVWLFNKAKYLKGYWQKVYK
ncbi:MAG: dTDP-glucose 4,6-dehydratase [Candidatus Omnitrophota bacterium]